MADCHASPVILEDERAIASVPGWFGPHDIHLFNWLLVDQDRHGVRGDLVEIGAYLGKSAVVVGAHVRQGEHFTVVDLFGAPAGDDANQGETEAQYAGLTRAAFESNYLRFHDELPVVIQDRSAAITDHVSPSSVRFMHIDGSHLYEHVRGDVKAAQMLLAPQGVVVFDDYRSEHTPGTAAAVWEAVATGGLRPLVLTTSKLYGSWGVLPELQERLLTSLRGHDTWRHEVEEIAGMPVIRVFERPHTRAYNAARFIRRHLPARLQVRVLP